MKPGLLLLKHRTLWRLRHIKQLAIVSVVASIAGVALLANRYGATPDEALTLYAIFVSIEYALFRAVMALVGALSAPRETPRQAPPVVTAYAVGALALMSAISAGFASVGLVLTAVTCPFLDLQRFTPIVMRLAGIVGLFAAASMMSVFVWAACCVAWDHRDRLWLAIKSRFIAAKTTAYDDLNSHWVHH